MFRLVRARPARCACSTAGGGQPGAAARHPAGRRWITSCSSLSAYASMLPELSEPVTARLQAFGVPFSVDRDGVSLCGHGPITCSHSSPGVCQPAGPDHLEGLAGRRAYPGGSERLSNQLSPERHAPRWWSRAAAPAPWSRCLPWWFRPSPAPDAPPQNGRSRRELPAAARPSAACPAGLRRFGGVSRGAADEMPTRSAGAAPGLLTESRSGAFRPGGCMSRPQGSKEAAERKAAEIRASAWMTCSSSGPGRRSLRSPLGLFYKNEARPTGCWKACARRASAWPRWRAGGFGAAGRAAWPERRPSPPSPAISERLRGANRLEAP